MSVVCRSFRQNAWKKDLCSDCFRPENDHQLVDAHTPSNGPNIITTTDWNGKVQALQSSKVNITEFKKTGSTNGYNKVNNGKNNMNENHVNTYKKSTPTTPLPSINHADENSFCNGDIINGKVAILNQRNLDKSDELSEAMKSPTTNGHSDKLNGNCQNNKQMVNKSNSKQPITKIVGILKVKSESGEQARKGSVQFKCDPIVIGYCDDDDSGNEEEEELDYCDYSRDEDDDYSEEESEFSRLTATNTRFNSIGANLRDAKIIQTFGQINNQSNGIAFRIGDFKSETKKHDYDETLIGCNRVSELIGEEKRVKLTNGSTVCSSTQNGINNRSSTTATTNSCGNNYINNRRNLVDDVLIKTSNDVNGSNSLGAYDESNSRKEDGSGNINNNNKDNNSSSPINLSTLNSNVVASSLTDSSSSTPVTGASSQANKNSTTTTTPSLTYSSVKLSAPINTSTNKIDNLPASINTLNSDDSVLVSTQVNGEININNDPSLANIVTNGEASTDYTSKNSSNSNSHNAPSALTSSPYCPTMGNATANKCSSSNKIDTCVSKQTALSSQSTSLALSPLSIVTIAPIQSEAFSVNAEEKSMLQNKSCIENNDNTQSKPIVMINDDSHNIKIDSANSATEKLSSLSSPNEVTFEKLSVTNGEATRLEISVDHSIDSNKIMELNNIYSTSNYVEETEVIFGDDSRSRLSLVTKNDESENELCSDAEEDDRKNLEPLDSEIKSNDNSDIDDCSYTTDIADSTMSNVFISTDEEVNDNDDKTDNDDINEANDGVLKSSVSLTLVTKSSETTEERSVESIDDETNINNNNTINGKVNSIYDERIEIPKKPERTLKSPKPKIPSKPLSLSHSNKVNDEEYFYGIGIETHANSNDSISDQNKQHNYDNELIHSLIDQSTLSKSEMNSPSCDTNHQSSRELRLAELAQELESVRHLGKRQAPLPPPPTHEIFVRSAKLNTLTRSGLPAPPPRPPPPSGLKHIVNGITSGYTGSNNFHSNGNNNNSNSNNNNSGGTKFSLKKLLKLSKDDNDLEHNGESINGKNWKHKFDLDRRKSSPSHRIECVDRSTSGSYDFGGPSLYANGRERSYSLSGNSCLPQAHQLLFNQQQQPNKTNGFRPIVPARRSRSNDINSQNNDKNSSDGLMSHRFPISSTNGSSSGKSVGVLTQSQLTISPVSSSACSPLSNTDSISSPSPPSSSTSPLPRSTAKLSSPSDLILTNLNLDSAYTVIAKYNADTVNRILHNYSMAHQSYKNISKKDLFYESFRLIGPDSKIYKDAYLKSETISAHFLVTPLSYSIRSEASHDLKYGQFIDSDENVKLFALKPEFDLIVTLDRLLDEDFSELTGILNLKSAAFLILQFISLLKYYQANGIEEINEDQLKLTMLCCNKKQSTNNMYLISPSFEYVTNSKREYSDSSTCFSLCKCVKTLVKNLKRKLIKSDDLLASVEDILNEETTSSLSEAKTICEIILFEVPFNFESQCTLELWLDIQRTKFINLLNYEGGTESVSHKTVYNYFFMLFLTRVNLKMLFQCINQMRGKLLPFS